MVEALKQISAPLWLLGIVGAIITGFISLSILSIAKDARQGHDLAVRIEYEQKIFSATLTDMRDDLKSQRESSDRLREQYLLLDQSTKSMSDLIDQQNQILKGLGDLSYRVQILEARPEPEQFKQQERALDNLRMQLKDLRRRVNKLLPRSPHSEMP